MCIIVTSDDRDDNYFEVPITDVFDGNFLSEVI